MPGKHPTLNKKILNRCFRFPKVWLLIFWLAVGSVPLQVCAEEDSLELYARSAVLMDGSSGRILYGKEEDAKLPMASTTKIMTCIVALENASPDTVCTVSGTASAQPQVKLGMIKGDTFYLKDLLYSLMLESHNDTAVCIAENIAGSVEDFAAKMNEKAAEIGCSNTYYITPNGLDAQDGTDVHHTTAAELALVMRYCLTQSPQAEAFLDITGTQNWVFTNTDGTRTYSCTNHNTFLQLMDGALSGKTGFTGNAGYCYVGALKRGDRLLIVALLACGWPNNKGYKWVDTKKLMNYGLENFAEKNIIDAGVTLPSIPVAQGQQESVSLVLEQPKSQTLLLKETDQVTWKLNLSQEFSAPVEAGAAAGSIQYYINGVPYVTYPVYTGEAVGLRDYWYCLGKLWGWFCHCNGYSSANH